MDYSLESTKLVTLVLLKIQPTVGICDRNVFSTLLANLHRISATATPYLQRREGGQAPLFVLFNEKSWLIKWTQPSSQQLGDKLNFKFPSRSFPLCFSADTNSEEWNSFIGKHRNTFLVLFHYTQRGMMSVCVSVQEMYNLGIAYYKMIVFLIGKPYF